MASKPRKGAGPSKSKDSPKAKTEPQAPTRTPGPFDFLPALRMAREIKSWADKTLSLAEGATDMSIAAARMGMRDPKQKAAASQAGEFLRAAREAAGITTDQLGTAIDLADPSIIDKAEKGAAASLPFDTILRLAGVLGRNDPLSFAFNLTRAHNPEIWNAMETYGFGKLVAQAGREREFANIYRANDAARLLSDEEFARVLKFVAASFDMAVEFFSSIESGAEK